MSFSSSGIETIRDPLLLQIKNKELGTFACLCRIGKTYIQQVGFL